MGTEESGSLLEIIKVVSRSPKGLSCHPGCQMETFSAFHVSTGPTDSAWEGTPETAPPPDVRAFWMIVIG